MFIISLLQNKAAPILKVLLFVFGVLYLISFILGIALNTVHFTDYGVCLFCGFVGIVSCVAGFFGLRFNQENASHKTIYKLLIIAFFIVQVFFHIALFLVGVAIINTKKVVDVLVKEKIDNFFVFSIGKQHKTGMMSGVGVFVIIVAIALLGLILMTIFHMGFRFFFKLFIGTISIIELMGVLILFSGGLIFFSAYLHVAAVFFLFCAAVGIMHVCVKECKGLLCLRVVHAGSLFVAVAFVFALVVIIGVLRFFLPGVGKVCKVDKFASTRTQRSVADVCDTFVTAVREAACMNLPNDTSEEIEEKTKCMAQYDEEVVLKISKKVIKAVLNVGVFFSVYVFLLFLLAATLACVIICLARKGVLDERRPPSSMLDYAEDAQAHADADGDGRPLYRNPAARGGEYLSSDGSCADQDEFLPQPRYSYPSPEALGQEETIGGHGSMGRRGRRNEEGE